MAAQGSRKDRVPIAPGTPPAIQRAPDLRVVRATGQARKFRVVLAVGREEVDVTGALTASLAHALWQMRGGEDIANWVSAEVLIDGLLVRAEDPALPSAVEVVVPRKPSGVTN
jgi:hypothetical protein